MMTIQTILWRRLDRPGHEASRLDIHGDARLLSGTAAFLHEGQACCLEYTIVCDEGWRTRRARVLGWVGAEPIAAELSVTDDGRWRYNGEDVEAVAGCVDIDLNFSPSTNLLPIRRLDLAVGAEGEVRAAWLRFPSFRLEPLAQVYRRLGETTYGYESAGGAFTTEIEVNAQGIVTRYPGVWEAE